MKTKVRKRANRQETKFLQCTKFRTQIISSLQAGQADRVDMHFKVGLKMLQISQI